MQTNIFNIKTLAAALIDEIHLQRQHCTDGEMKAQYTLAIRNIQQGQSWATKAATWEVEAEEQTAEQ